MAPTASRTLALASLATLSLKASAYTLTGYSGLNCAGDVQQTITDTKYGAYCNYFDDKVGSIGVSGGGDDFQWIFFNNYPCSSDTQVGSFIGNGCINQGETKLKAVTNILVEGDPTKRDLESNNKKTKRETAGIIKSWTNSDCSGAFTNELQFAGQNLPVTLNNVGSAMVTGVRDQDTAFACTDDDCHVDNQVAQLENGVCTDLSGQNVQSAMVIGVPTPARKRAVPKTVPHSLILESRAYQHAKRQDDESIVCDTDNLPDYEDALRTGDDWQGDNGLACCCHVPGGPSSKSDGTAAASISDNIQCPADPSGTKPPPSSCPLNCNEMRSYVYAIATQCKTDDGKTGGTYNLPAGEQIRVYHS